MVGISGSSASATATYQLTYRNGLLDVSKARVVRAYDGVANPNVGMRLTEQPSSAERQLQPVYCSSWV